MANRDIQFKRVGVIEEFIAEHCGMGNPPTIDDIIGKLDAEGLLEEINNEPYLKPAERLEKKKNVFRNLLKTHTNIECNKAGSSKPTYYLVAQKKLSQKTKRLKGTLEFFRMSEPLSLGYPIIDGNAMPGQDSIQPCAVYFVHKESKLPDTVKRHIDTLVYRFKINFKDNSVFTGIRYLGFQFFGDNCCYIVFETQHDCIDFYNRICEVINNEEAVVKEEDI